MKKDSILEKIYLENDRLCENLKNKTLSKTNFNKQIKKLNFLEILITNIDDTTLFVVEGVRGNGDIRNFEMFNAGSLAECIVNYFYTSNPVEIVKSGLQYDRKRGFLNVEIKSSLSCNCLATPSEKEFTILVNACGVFEIKKSEIMLYVNNQNRLPYNKPCGRLNQRLTTLLCINDLLAELDE